MQRDRPLQNSMFLPETNPNRRPSVPLEYNFPLPLKSHEVHSNADSQLYSMHQRMVMQQSRQHSYNTNAGDDGNVSVRSGEVGVGELLERIERLGRVVERHEQQLVSLGVEGDLARRVMSEVKKNLPVFTGGNDVYEHILNLKMEVRNVQEEISRMPKLSDIDMILKRQTAGLKESNASSSTNFSNSSASSKSQQIETMLNELLKKRDENLNNLFSNIDTEISLVKKTISTLNLDMKVSPITSSSAIMLKYQQVFKAKNRNQPDIVLNEHTYYVDNEGHLLDCNSRYIVDQKGKKIKLEEKHLSQLRERKILQ